MLDPLSMKYATVSEVAREYKISKSSLYRLSKSDPSFPSINIGFKKKLVIDIVKFIT